MRNQEKEENEEVHESGQLYRTYNTLLGVVVFDDSNHVRFIYKRFHDSKPL